MKKLVSVIALAIFFSGVSLAQQTGKIRGKVLDAKTNEAIPFATVVLFQNGIQKKGMTTDFDGVYSQAGLKPGKYDVQVQYVGYAPKQINGVDVIPGETRVLNIKVAPTAEEIEEIEVVTFVKPLIERTGPTGGMDNEQITQMGTRNVADVVTQVGGTVSADDGQTPNIKGARASGTVTFLNGVKVIGAINLPPSSLERVDVLTGGIPAQYGDVVGGVVSLTTKGAASKLFGGFEYETGRPFDQWNTDILGFNLSGPIITAPALNEKGEAIKDADGNVMKDTKLGYFLAGQFNGARDPRPSPIGITQVQDDVLQDLFESPLQRNSSGYGFRAENLTADDFYTVKVRPNVNSRNISLNGSLDFQPSENTVISVGGSYSTNRRKGYTGLGEGGYIFRYSLLNYNSNPLYRNTSYNMYARLQQTLDNGKSSDSTSSAITNAFYQVQVDYSKSLTTVGDENHGANFFRYGHVGHFDTDWGSDKDNYEGAFVSTTADYTQALAMPLDGVTSDWDPDETGVYYVDLGDGSSQLYMANVLEDTTIFDILHTVSTSDAQSGVYLQNGISGVSPLQYTRSSYNDLASNVFDQYYQLQDEVGAADLTTGTVLSNLGYFNGGRAPLVNSLWYGAGRAYGGYSINDNSQIRLTARAQAEINKKHSIMLGFEYEQRDFRQYSVDVLGIWGIARDAVNQQFQNNDGKINYDLTNFINEDKQYSPGRTYYDYDYSINAERQTAFDKGLRERMGYAENYYIDLDELNPDDLQIGDFDANTLWDFGGGAVSYRGYDKAGNRIRNSDIQFEDFFTDLANRPQGSFNPIYTAFFVEDKFEIEDLIIRFGVRLDRYDANQRVLKDKYSTVDLALVGETNMAGFSNADGETFVTPGIVEDDWAIYVDKSAEDFNNNQNEYEVLGFRDGDTWYDASGNEVRNPTFFAGGSNSIFNPWFDFVGNQSNTEEALFKNNKLTLDAFEDYRPQLNVMPRLAFSFPISNEAGFYAHYDVLTQRPSGNIITPSDYFYLSQRGSISNANLRPVRKINYQLGFQQKITDYSALTLEAFYNEFRDQVAFTRVNYAYPASYTTFDNLDFGTSKGLTIGYDLRRKKNFRGNISYTVMFAEGTGSGTGTAGALISAGFDNLKIPFPLNFDQRHAIKANLDYRFQEVSKKVKAMEGDDSGTEGSAPKSNKLAWYSNLGVNFTVVAGSGTPYSKNASRQSEVLLGAAGQSKLDGSPNGSRLPWNFRATARVDKDIRIRKAVKADKDNGVEGKNAKYVNVYLYVQNVFNNKNVLGVYNNTGEPDDDGYLVTVPDLSISQIDMYNVALNNPSFISLPRRARVGLSYSF